MRHSGRPEITAVLGPTNAGKTHLAVGQMLTCSSGMIAFPLRQLAREVYERVVRMRGPECAALITGEERIWPDSARYLLGTTEALPMHARVRDTNCPDTMRDVAFVALDEAHLAQDAKRGHHFTAWMLEARGREQTMILGSASLAPAIRHLLPEAKITSRPRFSTLRYDGPKQLASLPPRTAIIAFSSEQVYSIADALRQISGGAAVVMDGFSQTIRNAQMRMFQSGEVDYLVASDAVGLGLNLRVEHLAFASLDKFDGTSQRRLTLAEMTQVAGRAGSHLRDGRFSTIGEDAAFTPEEIEAVEAHHFEPVEGLFWRNPNPSLDSVAALIADLEAPPADPPADLMLRPASMASDLAVMHRLHGDPDAMAAIDGSAMVQRFADACSLPDFRQAGLEAHGRLVGRIWQDISSATGHIDADWFLAQLQPLDIAIGTVEVLAERIAAVRSFCYMAHQADWLAEPQAMAEQAREVESRLSDALHEALTTRFVDRRTSVLLRALEPFQAGWKHPRLPLAQALAPPAARKRRKTNKLEPDSTNVDQALEQDATRLSVEFDETGDGMLSLDGEVIGRIDGFTFLPDPHLTAADQSLVLAAAEQFMAVELATKASALAGSYNSTFALQVKAGQVPVISWYGRPVATLQRGKHLLSPDVVLDPALAALDSHIVAAAKVRVVCFVDETIGRFLRPIVTIAGLAGDAATPPALAAVLAMLVEGCGSAERSAATSSLRAMDGEQRQHLFHLGVRIGSIDLFMPALMKPMASNLLTGLRAAWRGEVAGRQLPPGIGLVAAGDDDDLPLLGYRRVNDWWLRIDLVEKFGFYAHNFRCAPPSFLNRRRALDAATASLVDDDEAATSDAAASEPGAAADTVDAIGAASDASDAPDLDHDEAPSSAAFRISPELGISVGLPLPDRLAVLQLHGFRVVDPPQDISAETEPKLWWIWSGRKQDHAAKYAPGAKQRHTRNDTGHDTGLHPGQGEDSAYEAAQPDIAAPTKRSKGGARGKARRKGSTGSGFGRHESNDLAMEMQWKRQQASPDQPNNPFAALADIFKPEDGDAE